MRDASLDSGINFRMPHNISRSFLFIPRCHVIVPFHITRMRGSCLYNASQCAYPNQTRIF